MSKIFLRFLAFLTLCSLCEPQDAGAVAKEVGTLATDVAFLVDESIGKSHQNTELTRKFLRQTAKKLLNARGADLRLALTSFSKTEQVHSTFSERTQEFFDSVADFTPRKHPKLRLDNGLRGFAENCHSATATDCVFGSVGDRGNASDVLIILTASPPQASGDGLTDEFVAIISAYWAAMLRARGIKVIVVAVELANEDKLFYLKYPIASAYDMFYWVETFKELPEVKKLIAAEIYSGRVLPPAPIPVLTDYFAIPSAGLPKTTAATTERPRTTRRRTSKPRTTQGVEKKEPEEDLAVAIAAPVDDVIVRLENICAECLERNNQRQYFPDPINCHFFLQCGRNDFGDIFASSRPCPKDTYWNDNVLTCTRDVDPGVGPTQCMDPCSFGEIILDHSCWHNDESGCSYYKCANTNSQPHCCPQGTNFNVSSCSCDIIAGKDACSHCRLSGYIEEIFAVQVHSDGSCTDSRNHHLRANSDTSVAFHYVFDDGILSRAMPCSPGTFFRSAVCDCIFEGQFEPVTAEKVPMCLLHLPLDEADGDFKDASIYNRFVYNSNVTSISGSGNFSGMSLLEIPGFMSYDWRSQASFCIRYRCATEPCLSGGLLSNSGSPNDPATWSVILGVTASHVAAHIQLWHGKGTSDWAGEVKHLTGTAREWTHVCAVLTTSEWQLWLNGALVDRKDTPGGEVAVRHCPLVVGADHQYGNYTGQIDDVLVCELAMSSDQIAAHLRNDIQHLQSEHLLP